MSHVPGRLFLITALLGASSACGWLAGSGEQELYIDPAEEAAAKPRCRPPSLDARGEAPWKAGDTIGAYTVKEVDTSHEEYVRVTVEGEGVTTALEIAFNEDGPGDWSTERYRLMPAPDEEPPQDLLEAAMAGLRTFASANPGDAFVKRTEGVVDPYEGLPPCSDADEAEAARAAAAGMPATTAEAEPAEQAAEAIQAAEEAVEAAAEGSADDAADKAEAAVEQAAEAAAGAAEEAVEEAAQAIDEAVEAIDEAGGAAE